MHPIEQKINLFLEQICDGKASFSEDLIQEFGERCKDVLRSRFVEKPAEENKFYLRMSNIGRPIRQLLLDKAAGSRSKPTPQDKLKYTIGHLYEAFMLALLKQSGVNVVDHDKQVVLPIAGTKIYGTYDIKIDDKVYDIKTASPYAYEYKFDSIESLRNGDAFGYFAQGFGYGIADGSPFGGWIVANKATGAFKVLEIPKYEHDKLREEYKTTILNTVEHVINDKPIPPCDGVVDEYFGKTKTGNKILNRECEWCNHKKSCHSNLQYLPDVNSKAKTVKLKYYIGEVIKNTNTN